MVMVYAVPEFVLPRFGMWRRLIVVVSLLALLLVLTPVVVPVVVHQVRILWGIPDNLGTTTTTRVET